jgi:hypothetical protein
MTTRQRHRALVRIFVEQDPDDPLTFVVTEEPGDNAIPVIPTSKAHELWLYSSANVADAKKRHPSTHGDSPPDAVR